MSGNVKDLDEKSFDEFVSKGNAVIDFWAEWCGPCKMFKPIFEETAGEFEGKVKFGKVDVDKERDLATKFDIMSIPTMIFMKDGKDVERVSGVLSKEDFKKKIDSVF